MTAEYNLAQMDDRIRTVKKMIDELYTLAEGFPAVRKNAERIMANIKMLEINISDIIDV